MPFRDKPVRRQASVKRAAGGTLDISQVASCNATQAADVQIRISGLQRIKCPFHQKNSSRQRILTLRQFQSTADSEIAEIGKYSCHVRMKVGPAVANAGIGEN